MAEARQGTSLNIVISREESEIKYMIVKVPGRPLGLPVPKSDHVTLISRPISVCLRRQYLLAEAKCT